MSNFLEEISGHFRSIRRKIEFMYIKRHILSQIRKASVDFDPFGHIFIHNIFPKYFYKSIQDHMLSCKTGGNTQARLQDSKKFTNKRFNLYESEDFLITQIRSVFSDEQVKLEFAKKFYAGASPEFIRSLEVHKEFEYLFTSAGLVQNIHIDIPPKYLSLVFYMPTKKISAEEERLNATVLYDKNLKPNYKAFFRANCACIFAPHFYSYHGYSTTIERDSLVIFYVNRQDLADWRKFSEIEASPFLETKNKIKEKLALHPLIEYEKNEGKISVECETCLVNAPHGRVLSSSSGMG